MACGHEDSRDGFGAHAIAHDRPQKPRLDPETCHERDNFGMRGRQSRFWIERRLPREVSQRAFADVPQHHMTDVTRTRGDLHAIIDRYAATLVSPHITTTDRVRIDKAVRDLLKGE